MRADQYQKLKTAMERLLDVFIAEADPDVWPGAGLVPAAMDSKTRGDRVWCKKDAAATMSIIQRVDNITRQHEGVGPSGTTPEPEEVPYEEQERIAERQATKLIEDVQKRIAARGKAKS